MTKKISIAIDAMGGDNSPDKTIEGVKIFLNKYKLNEDFELNIFGKKDEVLAKFQKYKVNSTPTLFINQKKFEKTLTYKNLKKEIEKLL